MLLGSPLLVVVAAILWGISYYLNKEDLGSKKAAVRDTRKRVPLQEDAVMRNTLELEKQ